MLRYYCALIPLYPDDLMKTQCERKIAENLKKLISVDRSTARNSVRSLPIGRTDASKLNIKRVFFVAASVKFQRHFKRIL